MVGEQLVNVPDSLLRAVGKGVVRLAYGLDTAVSEHRPSSPTAVGYDAVALAAIYREHSGDE